jgi:O-antigen/teichoic acid export membrane protein
MSFYRQVAALADDSVRLVQGFMICRLTGILLASVVIARRLDLQEVGVFEMLMFCGYLFTFFWSEALLKAFLARKSAGDKKQEITSFLLIALLISCASMMLLFFGQQWFVPLLTDRIALEGLAIFIVFQALIIPVGMLPFLGAVRPFNIVLLSGYVLLGPAFACYAGTDNYPGLYGVLIGLVSYGLVGFMWILVTTPLSKELAVGSLWKQLWPVAWPLMLYTIAAGLARSFDAWLVARHFDEQVFAVFRYGAREFPIVLALAGGMSTIMIAKLLQPDGPQELKQRTTRLMHICYPIIAITMLISVPLFAFVFGGAFRESAWIFNVYLLLTLFQLIFPQTIITARGDTRWLWYISMIELGVNIMASLVLLHFFGLIGIAFGTLIAFCVEKVLMLWLVRRRYGLSLESVFSLKTWVIYAVLLLINYFLALWIFGE